MLMATAGTVIRRFASRLPSRLLRLGSRPAAVFFHGVEAKIEDARAQSNHHARDAFLEIAEFLRTQFEVLPLAEIGSVLRSPDRHRRAVFLMCDDGYANNLEAAEMLSSLALPWTLFVSTRHIDTGRRSPLFVARIFVLFAPDGTYDIPHLGTIELGLDREREADRTAARLKSFDAPRAEEAVAAMQASLSGMPALLERFRSDAFLNWEQVMDLRRRGVEIGAHADIHWAMHAGQSEEYLDAQAVKARMEIERHVGPCRYFAYPFGNIPDVCGKAWRAVRDAGYAYAFTTLSGTLDASLNPFLMPRYGLAPREPHLPSVIPSLRLGNGRLRAWQRQMAR